MTKLNGKLLISKLTQILIFVAIGVFSRILPHPVNFAPIGAMALFGGTYMKRSQALILPLLAMIMSDFVIGFDSLLMRLSVYGCFMLSVFIGFWIKKHKKIGNIFAAATLSSILFFVITNFTVWLGSGMYTKNIIGLIQCYTLAIPFFRNTILGDLFYTSVLFGSYELVTQTILKPATQKSKAR